MAERRMFHSAVVGSDAFLDMPAGAQALYFHMGMSADDDGFVNGPRQIARKLRRPPKDIRTLVDSGFLLDFDGVMVIKHWLVANSLKNDRLKYPRFPDLAKKLYIKDDRSYTTQEDMNWENLLDFRVRTLESKRNLKVREGKVSQPKVKEGNRTEENITEDNLTEIKAAVAAQTSQDFAAATAIHSDLKFMNGKLGKGVVLLSEDQIGELLEKMGLDSFDYYVEKLASFIQDKDAKVKNHYATILKWWEQDRRLDL